MLGILGVVASLRYELAIPMPKSDKEAANIAILSLLVVLVITLLSSLAVWAFGFQLVNLLNTPELASHLWLLPIGLFLLGVYQVFQYWAIRTKEFYNIARTNLTQAVGMVITQIGGYTFGPIALLLGRVVGQSAGISVLIKSAFKKNANDYKNVTSSHIKVVAKRYKNFPIWSTWTGLASSAGLNLTPLLIASFLGAGAAGLFSLAHRVLSQPMAVIGKAVSDAFYQKAAESNREGTLSQSVERVYSVLVKLALAPAIAIFIIIPDIFVVIFGQNWIMAGELARWMTPWLFFQFIVSPCTGIYPIIDRHDIALRFQLSLLCASVLGSVIGGLYFKDIVWVVGLISVLSSLVYLWRAFTTFRVVGLPGLVSIHSIFKAAPVSVLINTPLIAIIFYSDGLLYFVLGCVMVLLLWLLMLVKPLTNSE